MIQGDTLQAVWLRQLKELLYNFDSRPAPRGYATREVTGLSIRVNDLRNNLIDHPARNLNFKFAVAEFLWIAYGLDSVGVLTHYNSQMSRFSDDGNVLAGAYGPRLAHQWEYVLDALRRDDTTRQAVATIWTPNPPASKDVPCTISLQYLLRDGSLNCIVTMRSSDVWLGIPYDVYSFSQLANGVAGELKAEPGYIQFNLGSSHIYESDVEKAEKLLAESTSTVGLTSPRLPSLPQNKWLRKILEYPDDSPPYIILDPWSYYARALRAGSWREAKQILQEASR